VVGFFKEAGEREAGGMDYQDRLSTFGLGEVLGMAGWADFPRWMINRRGQGADRRFYGLAQYIHFQMIVWIIER